MNGSFRFIIKDLKEVPSLKENFYLTSTLNDIDKYLYDNYEIAYFLGYFFKYKFDSDNLPHNEKEKLIDEIKNKHLDQYFYLKKKPDLKDWIFFQIIFFVIGFTAIITGVIFTLTNSYTFHFNPSKLSTVFVSGSYYILFGILMTISSIIGIIRIKSKRKFIKTFINH